MVNTLRTITGEERAKVWARMGDIRRRYVEELSFRDRRYIDQMEQDHGQGLGFLRFVLEELDFEEDQREHP